MATELLPSDASRRDPAVLSIGHRLRFLAKDSVIYGAVAAINKALALVTFPLLARHFSVADFGVVDFFAYATTWLAILLVFGQDSAVARFIYEHKDEQRRQQIVSQSLALQLVVVLVLLPGLWWSSDILGHRLSAFADAGTLLRLILLQLPFLVVVLFSQGLLRWTFCRGQYLLVSLGSVALNMVLLVVAVLVFNIGVIGVFQIALAVQAVFGCVALFLIRRWLVVPSDFGFLRQMLPFAIPYGVICIIVAMVPLLERSLVTNLLGGEELGLYAAGAKIAMLVSLVVTAFHSGWGPLSIAIHKAKDAVETYNLVLKCFSIGICVAVLLLSAVGEPIITVLASERFAGAAIVIFPLSFGLAIQAISWITEVGITISKRSYLNLFGYAVFLTSSVLSMLLFAPLFGLVGIAFGIMTGYVTLALLTTALAQHAYPLAWNYRPAMIAVSVTGTVGLCGVWAKFQYGTGTASLIFVMGAAVVLVTGWQTFDRKEKMQILAHLGKHG